MSTPLLYLNGAIVEEDEARISPFDRGFLWGDGVYEITPCFDGKLFRLEDHLDRLYRSLRYVRIDPGLSLDEMAAKTRELLTANSNRLLPGGAYRVGHWVTRGVNTDGFGAGDAQAPTVMMFFRPIEVEAIARDQRDGIVLTVPATRRTPPEAIEARAKVTSKMNQILAELDANAHGAKSLMLDLNGNVAENSSANFFMVRDGVLTTPPERNILEGITRKVVFELADKLDIPLAERDFTMYDVAQAEEYFLTSSAICAMPVRQIDSFTPKLGIPGPVTQRLIDAFAEDTGYRFGGA
ncbi:MAG: aminotransferase class IV [Alphaproteobacteria bacterium]|jgi:branched-chain amino acid aminotransferase